MPSELIVEDYTERLKQKTVKMRVEEIVFENLSQVIIFIIFRLTSTIITFLVNRNIC